MESFGARQDTFINGIRIKTSSNSKSRTLLKWPHSAQYIATPETLADAGFFFSPSATDRDNVQCFACGKELSEWEKDDDPYSIHYDKCGRTCWWAMVRCGLEEERDKRGRYRFDDPDRVPTSRHMEQGRLASFSNIWPHTSKGHGAHPKQMARAGFVHTPTEESIDTATCLYCGTLVMQWEEHDDPVAEHRSRAKSKNCPLLAHLGPEKTANAKTPAQPVASSSTTAVPALARSRSHKSLRASSRAPSVDSAAESLTGGQANPNLGRSVLGRSTRGRPRVEPEPEPEEEEVVVPKVAKAPRGKKSTARSRAPTPDDEDEPEPEPEPEINQRAALGKSTRGRPRGAASIASVASVAEPEPAPAKSTKASKMPARKPVTAKAQGKGVGRTASIASVTFSEAERTDDEPEKERATLGRSTRKKPAKAAPPPEDEDEEEPAPVAVPKKGKRNGRSTINSEYHTAPEDAEAEPEPTHVAEPAKGRRTRAASVARSVRSDAEPDLDLEATPAPKKRGRPKKSAAPQRTPSVSASEAELDAKTPVAKPRGKPRAKSVGRKSRATPASDVSDAPVQETVPASGKAKGKGVGKQKATRAPSRSAVVSAAEEEDDDQEHEQEEQEEAITVAPTKPVKPTKPATRPRAKSRGRSTAPSEESDVAQAQAHAKRVAKPRAKSRGRSVAPSDQSDAENVPPAKAPAARGKGRAVTPAEEVEAKPARRQPARSRGRSVEPEPEPEEEPEQEFEAAPPKRATKARARSRGPSVEPEPEEPAAAAPLKRTTAAPRARSRGPSVIPTGDEEAAASAEPIRQRREKPPSRTVGNATIDPAPALTKPPSLGSRAPLATLARDNTVASLDELDLLHSYGEHSPTPDPPKHTVSRSKPPSTVPAREAVPFTAKAKGKGKAVTVPSSKSSSKLPSRTSNVLEDTFAEIKAHEDSDLDSDAQSPQPMTPAPAKVRLATPEELTEDETFDRASSPSPVKPKRVHPHSQPRDPNSRPPMDMDEDDGGEENWEREESTVILARPLWKGTPVRPRGSSLAKGDAGKSKLGMSALAQSAAEADDDEDMSDADNVEFSVIDVGSDEETRAWKLQPTTKPASYAADTAQLTRNKPSSSGQAATVLSSKTGTQVFEALVKKEETPSNVKFAPVPISVQAQETKPPKLPTKQEAARAQEAATAKANALRTRFASPPRSRTPPKVQQKPIGSFASGVPPAGTDPNTTAPATAAAIVAPPPRSMAALPILRNEATPPQEPSVLPSWLATPETFPSVITDEERAMTVEQWIRKQARDELARFQRDAELHIAAFERQAAKTRLDIQARVGMAPSK